MKFDRRDFLAAAAATAALPVPAFAATTVRPEDFGARGDGRTNDTRAFAAMSAEIIRRGGGTVSLTAGRTYILGAQTRGGNVGWTAARLLEIHHVSGPIRILGNGARLRVQPGLKFGTFDPLSGQPVQRERGNRNKLELANVCRGLIDIHDCTGPIEIRDVELDGNIERLQIGGRFGDAGWQVAAHGLRLQANSGPETITNVFTHHHGTDGAMIVGMERIARSRISRLVSRYNGRQGLSITGGSGYDFADCEFSHTGRSVVRSAPGAGLDIEAEAKRLIRDLTFTRCSFADNRGCGMVADSGQSENVRFASCTFIGTTNWSAWPKKPGYAFEDCSFVGALVHAFGDADPARATRFTGCRFTDDPAKSPTGQVFTGQGAIASIGPAENVQFDRCDFTLVGDGTLPASLHAIYRDCTMSQRSPRRSAPRGRFLGTTRIHGPVDLAGSEIEGAVVLNGRTLPRGRSSP